MRQRPERRHWQPRLPGAERAGASPLAAHVAAHPEIESIAELSYVAVDELGEDLVTLLVSRWPSVDRSGRLRFPRSEPTTVDVDRAALEQLLRRSRVPGGRLARRPLREGDAFAVRTDDPADLAAPDRRDPARWMRRPVYDITADARDAAKASFYGVLGKPIPPGLAADIAARPRHEER
jgi:hypothetical protein